jgi:hypothetical protein
LTSSTEKELGMICQRLLELENIVTEISERGNDGKNEALSQEFRHAFDINSALSERGHKVTLIVLSNLFV